MSKEKYIQFCNIEKDIPIFSQPWWLDIVCNNNWEIILVERNNKIIASMPFQIKSKLGFKIISMPKLTQKLGPYIKYPLEQKNEKKLAYEKDIMLELIDGLPQFDKFGQTFNYTISNWKPFYWKGFNQTTYYTYIVDTRQTIEQIKSGFSKKNRKLYNKINPSIKIVNDYSMEDFYKTCQHSYRKQGIPIPYSYSLITKINEICKQNSKGMPYFAIDENNNIHAVSYIVEDNISMYPIFGGSNINYKNSGAKNYIIFEAIKAAKRKGLLFDFEGSMNENISEFYRAFGGKQIPYNYIYKVPSPLLRFKKLFG